MENEPAVEEATPPQAGLGGAGDEPVAENDADSDDDEGSDDDDAYDFRGHLDLGYGEGLALAAVVLACAVLPRVVFITFF